ncbi:hypothetical protein TNCV_3455981 [Trichonephila clavipes]|nr:hypothetical protein TNCV_3455981 [Trichonephila clavipes]
MNSSEGRGGRLIRQKAFNCRRGKESFLPLQLRMMEKTAHQSEFDRKQITMAHRLGTSVSKTARLVKFSQSAILSICVKGINEGKTSSRCQSIGSIRILK